jgi:hypothetical protein
MVLLWNSFAVMAVLGLTSAASERMKRVCPAIAPAAKPVMASGYTATVVMKGLKASRDVVFDLLGNLLVVEQGGGGLGMMLLPGKWGT